MYFPLLEIYERIELKYAKPCELTLLSKQLILNKPLLAIPLKSANETLILVPATLFRIT